RFARLQEVELDRLGIRVIMCAVRSVEAGVEERYRHVENLRDQLQPPGRYPVAAFLVLLDLLERDAQRIAQCRLRHPALQTQRPDALGDFSVPRIAAALFHVTVER